MVQPDWREYVNEAFKDLVIRTKEIIESLEKEPKVIPWKTQNPGDQLVGSFNPIIEDPKKWYMSYYIDVPKESNVLLIFDTRISKLFEDKVSEKRKLDDDSEDEQETKSQKI
jgi:hypothetical protein